MADLHNSRHQGRSVSVFVFTFASGIREPRVLLALDIGVVELNFGPDADFEVTHKPLALQAMEQQSSHAGGGEAVGDESPAKMSLRRMAAMVAMSDDDDACDSWLRK